MNITHKLYSVFLEDQLDADYSRDGQNDLVPALSRTKFLVKLLLVMFIAVTFNTVILLAFKLPSENWITLSLYGSTTVQLFTLAYVLVQVGYLLRELNFEKSNLDEKRQSEFQEEIQERRIQREKTKEKNKRGKLNISDFSKIESKLLMSLYESGESVLVFYLTSLSQEFNAVFKSSVIGLEYHFFKEYEEVKDYSIHLENLSKDQIIKMIEMEIERGTIDVQKVNEILEKQPCT